MLFRPTNSQKVNDVNVNINYVFKAIKERSLLNDNSKYSIILEIISAHNPKYKRSYFLNDTEYEALKKVLDNPTIKIVKSE